MTSPHPAFPRTLLPDAPGLELLDVALTAHELSLELRATSAAMPCRTPYIVHIQAVLCYTKYGF